MIFDVSKLTRKPITARQYLVPHPAGGRAVCSAFLCRHIRNARGGGGRDASNEKAQLNEAVLEGYLANVQAGALRLTMRGCSAVIYTAPEGSSCWRQVMLLIPLGWGGCDLSGCGVG